MHGVFCFGAKFLKTTSSSFLRLGWRTLWRDVRAGELRLLVVAVLLAVAALSSVAFFADRLAGALQRDAAQLLGGDVVVSSDQPLPAVFAGKARALGLRSARTQTFPTMARAEQTRGGAGRLVTLKAVSAGYPLRGSLRVSDNTHWQPAQPDQSSTQPPQPGQVWVEAPLLEALQLQLDDTLLLGQSALRISRVLTQEPDRGGSFISFAPRVLMHADDLPATQLVQPASRVHYRLALVGSAAAVRAFGDWARAAITPAAQAAEAQSQSAQKQTQAQTQTQSESPTQSQMRGIRIETLQEGNPRMQETLDRASNFLNLVALLAALLSAVAVALAARAFAERHLDGCAILRVLGLPQRTIARAYALEFVAAGLAGTLLGLALGFAVHYVFVWLLGGLVQTDLPPPSWQPLVLGLGVGMTLLLAFGLPPVLQLAGTPPLRVMRRELGRIKGTSALAMAAGLAGFAALLLTASSDIKLGGIAVGGFAAAVLLFMLLGALAVWLVRRSMGAALAQGLPYWLRLALRQLGARPVFAVLQISSLGVGMLALVLLVLLRTDLVRSWRQATPADAHNRYIINILPEQQMPMQQALRAAGVAQFDWFPMVRGRLVAINGRAVSASNYADAQAQRLVEREFNLSYSTILPAWNPLEQGRWRSGSSGNSSKGSGNAGTNAEANAKENANAATDQNAISMEAGIMQTLGLKLGDSVVFDMGGVQRTSTITSVRKVNWSSMHVNFFAMYPVASLGDEVAVSYITSYRNPPYKAAAKAAQAAQPSLDYQLLQTFPNITQVDMDSTLLQLQAVLDKVIRAVELLFVFGLAAGLLVLFATVNTSRDERSREFAIMRALGSSSALLRRLQSAELLATGALAGLLAGVVALALGWALAHYVFAFEWALALWVLPASAGAGAVLAWAAGWWSLHSILRQPVVQTLRQAQ